MAAKVVFISEGLKSCIDVTPSRYMPYDSWTDLKFCTATGEPARLVNYEAMIAQARALFFAVVFLE
jgi:hypothetical protein